MHVYAFLKLSSFVMKSLLRYTNLAFTYRNNLYLTVINKSLMQVRNVHPLITLNQFFTSVLHRTTFKHKRNIKSLTKPNLKHIAHFRIFKKLFINQHYLYYYYYSKKMATRHILRNILFYFFILFFRIVFK